MTETTAKGVAMPNTYEEVLAAASLFDDTQKLELADALVCQVERPDPEIEAAWMDEVQRRHEAVQSGRMKTYSWAEVLERMRSRA